MYFCMKFSFFNLKVYIPNFSALAFLNYVSEGDGTRDYQQDNLIIFFIFNVADSPKGG